MVKIKKNKTISPDVARDFQELTDNFTLFAGRFIKIRDHNTGKILPLILNRGQKILHNVTEKQSQGNNKHVRLMLLKSRRFGGSTYTEGRYYHRTSLHKNRSAFIVGHEIESTNTLYAMATLMHEKNPLAPQTKKSNANELVFDNEKGTGLKSQYRLATAKNVEAGKSQGIHYLHCSEEGMWQGGGHELLSGLLQCVPDISAPIDTEIIRESTAKGYGNSFQIDCFAAYCEGKYPYYSEDDITYAWMNPDSDWIIVFIPWFVHSWYSLPFKSNQAREEFRVEISKKVFDKDALKWGPSDETRLIQRFKLTLEQLNWRQWAIKNKCRNSLDIFHQEYPSTVEEAFLSSGTNHFSPSLCDDLEAECKDSIFIGDVIERLGKPKLKRNKYGHMRFWRKPNKDKDYFMAVDSAGGIKQSQIEENRLPDPSCIDIYDHYSGEQVAQWHGHIDYDLIADMVDLIGQLFFMAPACIELNNHGYTVVAGLSKKKYPMYESKPGEPGWQSNRKTKPLACDTLLEMARDSSIQINCRETVSEMRTFVEEGGKYNAASGCHDERVDTAAMASMMFSLLPRRIRHAKQHESGIVNWHKGQSDPKNMGYTEVYIN